MGKECGKQMGRLATHLTKEDLDFVYATIIPQSLKKYFVWIGGRVNSKATPQNFNKQFKWLSGERISQENKLWEKWEPYNAFHLGWRCMVVYSPRKESARRAAFRSTNCRLRRPFLCEIR